MTTDTGLRTDTPEQQAIHYPITHRRRSHPLPDRAEWEITHRTVYSQDVSDVQDMITTDLHAYGTEDEIQAAAAEQLMNEYHQAVRRADAIPPGTDVPVPAVAVLIDENGDDLYANLDRVADTEQDNAVLTALAEAVTLDKLAAEARQRADALLIAFADPDTAQ